MNVMLVDPAGTVTLEGTLAAELLLESETAKPPGGAEAVSVTRPCVGEPPATLAGVIEIAESAALGAVACGMKRRTDDHALAVPAELIAWTRHQCWLAASVEAVNCEAVTDRSTTNGAENVLESSTWIR